MPKTTTGRNQTLTIRVGPSLRASIDEYARHREMSPSEFVRYCILVYLDTTEADPNAPEDEAI